MASGDIVREDAEATPRAADRQPNSPKKLSILYMQLRTDTFAGIERVIDEICSELVLKYGQEFDIDVFYPSKYKYHQIGERAYTKIEMDGRGKLGLMRAMRAVVRNKKYDLVVIPQVEPTVIGWVSCIGIPTKYVVYLHGNPKLEPHHIKAKILFYVMGRVVLRRLSGVFGVSPKQLEAFSEMFPNTLPRRWVPNPVRRFAMMDQPTHSDSSIVTFVNVGRFSYQKGQDILVANFAKLVRLRPNIRLRLVGYGSDEPKLREQIASLGLDATVSIEHYPENPQQALASSDIYVSTSRWEGWSLAICEALRFGLPVVSTDCEFGPSDILTDERLGRLIPTSDRDGFVNAMAYYCDNLAIERKHSDYRKRFIDQYSVEKVVHTHADALREAARGP